jgi:hypothetical protein
LNLVVATFGNIIGGTVFLAGMYWVGSSKAREAARRESSLELTPAVMNGSPHAANGSSRTAKPAAAAVGAETVTIKQF